MTTTRPTVDRDALVGADCTLDGLPATICGRATRFAYVWQTGRPNGHAGLRCEYAWETVAHVMAERGGRFRS